MKQVSLTSVKIIVKNTYPEWDGKRGEVLKNLGQGRLLVKIEGLINYWELEINEYEFVTKLGKVLE